MSTEQSIGGDWPQYRSHKVVRAVEITSVATTPHEFSMRLGDGRPPAFYAVGLSDPLIARYKPVAGDFLVRYEPDGYLSVSPRDKFLDGYRPEPPMYAFKAGSLSEEEKAKLEAAIAAGPTGGVIFESNPAPPSRFQELVARRDAKAAPIEIAMEARKIARELDARDLDIPPKPNAGFWNLTESVDWPANLRDGIMAFCAVTGSPVPAEIAADRYSDTMNEAERKVWRMRLKNALREKEGHGFMDFGRALYFLKEGRRVARSGWNGKGMWLMLVPEDLAEAVSFQYAALKPAPWIGMRTADEKFVPWLASQTDMLATDWTVVP